MMDGFIPYSRASGVLDLVALALFVILPLLGYSIYLVRVKKSYDAHRKLQIFLSIVLLVAITVFEVDMRVHGWRQFAEASRFYETLVDPLLGIHLFFAVSTTLLWIYVVVGALRNFPKPTLPGEYSARHRKLAWTATIGMLGTAITAWTFYIVAFMA